MLFNISCVFLTKPCSPTKVSFMVISIQERDLYQPIKDYLTNRLSHEFDKFHIEITATGRYSETIKRVVRHDIIFSFLRTAHPDLTGFVLKEAVDISVARSSDVDSFITVEVKPDPIKLQDVYQAKLYGDLFAAKYALLISPEIIGEEIRRLNKKLHVLNRYGNRRLYIGQAILEQTRRSTIRVRDIIWQPVTPF